MRINSILGLLILLPLGAYVACSSDDDASASGGGAGTASNGAASGTSGGGGLAGGLGQGGTATGGATGAAGASGGEAGEGVAGAPAVLSDAQIFMVVMDANSGEIDAAREAKPKATAPAVADCAQMMIAHHGMAGDDATALAAALHVTPEPSAISARLEADAALLLATLKATPAPSLDSVYMKSQVDAHKKVLAIVEDDLLPAARNAKLRALLTTMRAAVEGHLKEARMIVDGV